MNATKGKNQIFQFGGIASFIFMAYSVITLLILLSLGAAPDDVESVFGMLHENRLAGLLRLDILTVVVIPLYYLLFFSLYLALKATSEEIVSFSVLLVFAGLTLFLAAPSIVSMLRLSDAFASTTDPDEKLMLMAAGQAILASDMWHGTGAIIGGILLQTGAVLLSVVMLKGGIFNKWTAYIGIGTHGCDLLHIVAGFFSPSAGVLLMAIAGPLYLIWFPLIGFRLIQLGKQGRDQNK